MKMEKPNLFIASASEPSGFAAVETIMTHNYHSSYDRIICGVSPDQTGFRDKIRHLGAEVVDIDPKSLDESDLLKIFKANAIDCCYLVPPFSQDVDTLESTKIYINALKKADVKNVVLLTSIQPWSHSCGDEKDLDVDGVDVDCSSSSTIGSMRRSLTAGFSSVDGQLFNEFGRTRDMQGATPLLTTTTTSSVLDTSMTPPTLARKDKKHQYHQLNILLKIEKHLKATAIDNWVILRRAMYQELLLLFKDKIRSDSMFPLPLGYGALAPVSMSDVAHTVAILLTRHIESRDHGWIWNRRSFMLSPRHKNKIYTVTGPHVLTGYEMAMVASHAFSQSVTLFPDKLVWVGYTPVTRDAAREWFDKVPELSRHDVELILDVFDVAGRGGLDYVSWDFHRMTKGYPLKPLHKLLTDHADEFR